MKSRGLLNFFFLDNEGYSITHQYAIQQYHQNELCQCQEKYNGPEIVARNYLNGLGICVVSVTDALEKWVLNMIERQSCGHKHTLMKY